MIKWLIRQFEKYNKLSWIITILIAIAIFSISNLTFEGGAGGFGYKSLFYHLFAFFFLGLFLLISLIQGKVNNKKFFLFGILIAIAYGISDELHQFLVPGRYCCIEDVLINSAGILCAGVIYSFRIKFIKKLL